MTTYHKEKQEKVVTHTQLLCSFLSDIFEFECLIIFNHI